MNASEVRSRVDRAVECLNDQDKYLMQNDLSERCIASRLAMHLQALFEGYNVDVEYNRAGAVPKRLGLSEKCANFRDADGRSLVVPDIVVHRRGPLGPNLLVLELKKSTNSESPECDRRRIPAFVSELKYLVGGLVYCETKRGHENRAVITDWIEKQ